MYMVKCQIRIRNFVNKYLTKRRGCRCLGGGEGGWGNLSIPLSVPYTPSSRLLCISSRRVFGMPASVLFLSLPPIDFLPLSSTPGLSIFGHVQPFGLSELTVMERRGVRIIMVFVRKGSINITLKP